MQKLNCLIFMAMVFANSPATAQDAVIKLALISDIDSSMTHLYVGESDYDHVPTYYPFNLNEYIAQEFQRVFDTVNAQFETNYEFMRLSLPEELKMSTGLLNLSGKPKKKLRNYIEERKKIPVNHLEFATDNIKEMTSIKIEKILKAILRGNH